VEEHLFQFSLVPIMFPLSSQNVPIEFSIFSPSSQCISQHVLHSTSPLTHMFSQRLYSFQIYRWVKAKEDVNKTFYFGELPWLHLFFSDWPIKFARCK
jgi:hypothetical protein